MAKLLFSGKRDRARNKRNIGQYGSRVHGAVTLNPSRNLGNELFLELIHAVRGIYSQARM
jgi:hypothetical protein